MRKTDKTFYVHAESFRMLGYSIPDNDQKRAFELVPPGATVKTVLSDPADWSSVLGIIGNVLWIHATQVSGGIKAE